MVFNGLQKSDLIVFNALLECDISQPVPVSTLERLTCLHRLTIIQALQRLDDYNIISRRREHSNQPYKYKIRKDSYAVLDA